MKLIFAQGNPEPDYALTRHNIGFTILNGLADKFDAKWIEKSKFQALTAEISINGDKVLLVKPTSYYNETGTSARKIIDFYKINPVEDLLVIHDDLALPFGTIRTRSRGSDAGNNGIKSINNHIEHDYTRIRVGIHNDKRELTGDTDFVIGKFSSDEAKQLKSHVIPHAIELIEKSCAGDTIQPTSYKII